MDPMLQAVNSSTGPLPVDAGNYISDLPRLGKRTWTEAITIEGYNQLMSATKRQNFNTSNMNDQGDHGFKGINLATRGVQDGIENDEPKIVSDHFIVQGTFPSLKQGDLVFFPPDIGPAQIGLPTTRARYSGSPNRLTSVKAKNITEVNKILYDAQVEKLKKGNARPNDNAFYPDLLGDIEDYLNLYRYAGVLYKSKEPESTLTPLDMTGKLTYDGPVRFAQNHTKLVSIIHQGHIFIQDVWGGAFLGGTNLFLVLKPTLVASDDAYVTSLDKNIGFAFNHHLLDSSSSNNFMNTSSSGKREAYVVYQWQPIARSGMQTLDHLRDLSYRADNVTLDIFGQQQTKNDYRVLSAVYIRIGKVKHTVPEGVMGTPTRLSMSLDYKQIRSMRIMEVDILPQTLPAIVSS